jgi:hypothetical protein
VFGVKAADERNHNGWKKFDAGSARFVVTFNSYPNAPDQLTVSGAPCATGADRPYARTLTPELRARVSDPDGFAAPLTGTFWWWPLGSGPNGTDVVAQGWVASGAQAIVSIPPGRLVDGRTYVVQAQASDGIDAGQRSVTCEFTVDATPPETPAAVSSAAYPSDGQLHGGAGIAGSFTFTPPAASPADVAGYAYTLDTGIQPAEAAQADAGGTDHAATVSLTPPTDGTQTLRVWSRDRAGNFSPTPRSYQFGVRAGAGPDAVWRFDGSDGVDSSGHGNPLSLAGTTFTAGRGGLGKALELNETVQAYATTAGPLATRAPSTGEPATVRTDTNFTVSAWVRLGAVGSANQYAVLAQNGARTSAYALTYSGPDNRWRFAMAAADSDGPALAAVLSDAPAVAGEWTHLTATYDGSTHRLRLYVNGVAQAATATLTGGFNATGPVVAGRRLWAGAPVSHFTGAIDEVRVHARVVGTAESEFTNPLKPVRPTISFPDGTRGYVGRPLRATLGATGDTMVTSMRYGLDVQTMPNTAALPSPGGAVTVSVTPTQAGETFFFAAALSAAGRQSDTAAAIVEIAPPPGVSGTVLDSATGAPVAGATVRLLPGSLSVTTGPDGAYEFTGIDAGQYTVSAAVAGTCGLLATTELSVEGPTSLDLTPAPQSDRFGYTCAVTTTPFRPADATVVPLTGDDQDAQVQLPFPVPFYGQTVTQGWITTNGILTFTAQGWGYEFDATSIPAGAPPNAMVAPFWDDLVVDAQSSVRTAVAGAAPRREFIIEWRNVTFYRDSSKRISFELILAESGSITFNYAGLDDDVERGLYAAVGVESPGGAFGLQYGYALPILATGRAVTFTYPAVPRPIDRSTLSGVVRRADGTPVPNAVVHLQPNTDRMATTDAAGRYSIPDLEPNGYTVQTKVRPCDGAAAVVDLPATTTADLLLVPGGAPDGGGYTCTVADGQPFVPADQAVLPVVGDGDWTEFTLPFPVTFYGNSYPAVGVSSDGWIEFLPPIDGTPAGDGYWPGGAVDVYGTALVVDAAASVRRSVVGTAPSRQLIIEWRNVALSQDAGHRVTFEVILTEDGTITTNYTGLDDFERQAAAVGIEDYDAIGGMTYCFYEPLLANNRAVTFHPPAP